MKSAIVLLSGGLDSATCLAIAKSEGYTCYALSFDYGQRHDVELKAAINIAKHFNVKEHKIFELPIGQLGGSALTDSHINVPDYNDDDQIPVTYVPARNTIFISIGLAWAEILGSKSIFIGVNAIDYSHYPDCRPEYIEKFQELSDLATKTSVEGKPITIHTPLINLTKAEIINLGTSLGIDYGMTISCYQATDDGFACGKCDSCYLRKNGFSESSINDPTRYR